MKNNLLMRKHGKTFYWASFFLDKSNMQAIYSIYSFCRRVDDMVDEAKTTHIAKKRLLIFTEAWKKCRSHPVINLLSDIPKESYYDLAKSNLKVAVAVKSQSSLF